MRLMLPALLALVLLGEASPVAAQSAYDYPWCAQRHDRSGATSCYFRTWEQCQATISGIGGSCFQNPAYRGPGPVERRPYRSYRY